MTCFSLFSGDDTVEPGRARRWHAVARRQDVNGRAMSLRPSPALYILSTR